MWNSVAEICRNLQNTADRLCCRPPPSPSVANHRRPYPTIANHPPTLANHRKKRCFVTTSIQNRQKTLQITWFCANCVQKKHPKTTPKSTPQPPNFDECFGKSIQRVFSQLSFFNSLFDRFLRKSPCYGAILGWRFKTKQTQKQTQKCTPETSQAIGGER